VSEGFADVPSIFGETSHGLQWSGNSEQKKKPNRRACVSAQTLILLGIFRAILAIQQRLSAVCIVVHIDPRKGRANVTDTYLGTADALVAVFSVVLFFGVVGIK
jgi:hypothetical protein